jgi:HAAS
MEKAGVISDYVEALERALSFDRTLARCVRQEVEDHLGEAVAADPGDQHEAERRVIAKFGDPDVIAAQFAVVSLARRIRRVGAAIILVIAGVFLTMKARVAWYAVTQWTMGNDVKAIGAVVGSIDRYTFWLALLVGIAAFAYIGSRPVPIRVDGAFRRQIRLSFLLCTTATALLAVSVASDGILTALQLLGPDLCADALVPILSMAIEIACIGVLTFQIHAMMRRASWTAALPSA